jgi:fatty acid desaturase
MSSGLAIYQQCPHAFPFLSFRSDSQLHLLHHRHVNTEDDPDIWDSQGPMVVRAVKWFFPDVFWIKRVIEGKVKNPKIFEAVLFYLTLFWVIKNMANKNMSIVKYWILPQRAVSVFYPLSIIESCCLC